MTGFVALRCYKCSMMQVKQARKPGHKWTCSICNEKQSQVKEYACSTTAKELRKFVQDFNLSTHTAADAAGQQTAAQPPRTDTLPANAMVWANRPNKWHKYLSQDDEAELQGPSYEPQDRRYVTEMPEPKRARRKVGSSDLGTDDEASSKRRYQIQPKDGVETRNPAREPLIQLQAGTEYGMSYPCAVAQPSKWSAYLSSEEDENCWEP